MTPSQDDGYGEVEATGDSAAVTFARLLNASVERVWRALTDPADLALWLEEAMVEPGVDGRVEIRFDDGPVTGTITVWDPPHHLEYTWAIAGETESVVRFDLTAAGEATRLVLRHVGLPRAMGSGYGAGWHAHLDRLGAVVTGADAGSWEDRFAAVLDRYRTAPTSANGRP